MGNLYRIIVDLNLTCQLFWEIDENSEKFNIVVNTSETVYSLQKKVKEVKNEIFSDVEACDLYLWKVQDDKNKDMKGLIEGELSKFWKEQSFKKNIHLIVNSPYLIKKRKRQKAEDNLLIQFQRMGLHDQSR